MRSCYAPKVQPGIPDYRVNQGSTRGDAYAAATLDAPLGQALTALVAGLGSRPTAETA